MASIKPKKVFSMSLSKTKAPSSFTKGKPEGERAPNKSSAIGNHEVEAAPKRDYVTGVGGGKVVTKEITVERGPRVIALASNPWERERAAAANAAEATGKSTSSNAPATSSASNGSAVAAAAPAAAATAEAPEGQEKSLDQRAAEAIARESRCVESGRDRGSSGGDRDGLGLHSDRVIGMAAQPGAGGAEPRGGAEAGRGGGGKRTGLLEQNMIPGLADVEGEDAKFKHDLGHRAEDMNVRSKAYVDVPVSEFGAALLRGMGWTGTEGGDAGGGEGGSSLTTDVQPRHHRLGLGAQPKPPEEVRFKRRRLRV